MAASHGVLVVDFGAQYAQLIARRVREAKVYSEIVPSSITASEVRAKNPEAIILSGGPSSVYAEHAPKVDPAIFSLGIPVFGICYGFQTMAAALQGVVAQTGKSEFGRTPLSVMSGSKVFAGLPDSQSVWMSHGDAVSQAPAGFTVSAATSDTPIAAFEDASGKLAGVQFHPEVLHTEHGQAILQNWLINIAGCKPSWTTANIAEDEVAKAKAVIGSKRVICGLSGGVDSAVAAAIVQRAVGKQLTCVFVDHGLLRSGESEQVQRDFVAATGIELVVVDAVDVQRDVLDLRLPASGDTAVAYDRPRHVLLQLAVDRPDHFLPLLAIGLARLFLEELGHLRVAVVVVVRCPAVRPALLAPVAGSAVPRYRAGGEALLWGSGQHVPADRATDIAVAAPL